MKQRWHSHINDADWEALCDGCGLCCMHKFEDEDTGEILNTNVACKLFDANSCKCTQYAFRFQHVPNCLKIRDMGDDEMHWLPETCAYRLTFELKPLPSWHILVSKSKDSVHETGVSVRNACTSELDVEEEKWIEHVVNTA